MLQLDGNETEWRPSTEDERKAVHDQLERMLASPLFRNSKRYPALLQYVVEQALAGQDHLLKERVLGIEVFHRQPDYDTNQDTIVRLTAAEVRKRIAQYYQQTEHASELRIYLHPGSYVPHFRLVPEPSLESVLRSEAVTDVLSEEAEPDAAFGSSAEPAFAVMEQHAETGRGQETTGSAPPSARNHKTGHGIPGGFWFMGAAVVALLLLAGWLYLRHARHAPDAVALIWQPILQDLSPALLVVPDVSNTDLVPAARKSASAPNMNELDHLRGSRIVDFGDSLAMTRVGAYLVRNHKEFDAQLSSEATYTTLQKGPSIFVGGIDNAWTMRLLQSLRFRIERQGTSLRYAIVDQKQPRKKDWSLDLDEPFNAVTRDFGIIARLEDNSTGRPVVIIAGLGANGTTAATRFITQPELARQLKAAIPQDWSGRNMELIIETQVIDDKPGPPKLIAQEFW